MPAGEGVHRTRTPKFLRWPKVHKQDSEFSFHPTAWQQVPDSLAGCEVHKQDTQPHHPTASQILRPKAPLKCKVHKRDSEFGFCKTVSPSATREQPWAKVHNQDTQWQS